MKKETLIIKLRPVGRDGLREAANKLSWFVDRNFNIFRIGAHRLGLTNDNLPLDLKYNLFWRQFDIIRINNTIIHNDGILYYDGWEKNQYSSPSEQQLRNCIADLQQLIDAAAENINVQFELVIKEKK